MRRAQLNNQITIIIKVARLGNKLSKPTTRLRLGSHMSDMVAIKWQNQINSEHKSKHTYINLELLSGLEVEKLQREGNYNPKE